MIQATDLEGKVALITGGSKGLGRAMALILAGAGCHVAVTSRNMNEAEEAAREARALGRKAVAVCADVTKRDNVEEMVGTTLDRFGRIDILINNAGTNIRKPLLDLSEEEWDTVLDTNLKGVFLVGQQVGRVMVEQGKGKIINVASVAGVKGRPGLGAYCASKGGVIQLTRVMALEWAERNVQVNAIAPTYVRTPLTSEYLKTVEAEVIKRIPLGRLCREEDLAGLVLLLASGSSDFLTGQTFFIDGGSTA